MKKFYVTLVVALISAAMSFGQNSGLGFNYQAIVRKADGMLLANSDVTLRVSLYPGQSAANPTWVETHKVHTDVSGTFGVTVGKGMRENASVAAQYKDVNFAAVYYWMKIEVEEGGTFREVSFSQLPSSPYAEVAHNASSFAGMIAPFAGPSEKIPTGWLPCDGRAVNRSEYLNLYNAIGTCWGEGDGSTTFNLPDLRGMFLRGVSGESGNDADANSRGMLTNNGGNTGNNVGSYQGDAIRNIPVKGYIFSGTGSGGDSSVAFFMDCKWVAKPVWNRFDVAKMVPTGKDNRPKNVYVNYIIKY